MSMQNVLSLAARSIDRSNVTGRTASRVNHRYRNVTGRTASRVNHRYRNVTRRRRAVSQSVQRNLSFEFQNIDISPRRISDEDVVALAQSPVIDDRSTPLIPKYENEHLPYLEHVGFNDANVMYDQTTCVICLCGFFNNDTSVKTICGHVFHKKCIDKWFAREKTCPTCRKRF